MINGRRRTYRSRDHPGEQLGGILYVARDLRIHPEARGVSSGNEGSSRGAVATYDYEESHLKLDKVSNLKD